MSCLITKPYGSLNIYRFFSGSKLILPDSLKKNIWRKLSYRYQSSPTEGHIRNWLNNIIELFFLLNFYWYIHICYESCKKNQHDFNWKFLVLAQIMLLHYLLGGREGFKPSQTSKSTIKIKLKLNPYMEPSISLF